MRLNNSTRLPKMTAVRRKPRKFNRAAHTAGARAGGQTANGASAPKHRPTLPADGHDDLIAGLRSGRSAAVEALVERFQGRIFNLAMSILKNESDAEEAVQDVFMTVIRKIDTFKGDSAFYSWMYRICVNNCLMRLRRKRRVETVAIEEFLPLFTEDGLHASPVYDWSNDVDREALNEELGQMIRKFAEELSEKYRVAFVLGDIEGLSSEETAQILGMTVPAVKSRLHRARLYLRERLSSYLSAEGSAARIGVSDVQASVRTGAACRDKRGG